MPRVYIIGLSRQDRQRLEALVARGENWRERQRAQTLLHLDDGISASEVAQHLGIHSRTVCTTRTGWFKSGFQCLADLPRSGARPKLTPEQIAKLVAAAQSEPLTSPQLLAKHVADGGTPIKRTTLTTALKAAGLVWKRTRHSLKKNVMKLRSEQHS